MRVLLTGGAGYIGSFIAEELHTRGHQVMVLDNLSTGRYVSPSVQRFAQLDLRDRQPVQRFVQEIAPEGVIHVAALKSPPESLADPGRYYDHNVTGTINLLAALEGLGAPPIIFSSSSAVYGTVKSCPITEETPPNPLSPYGETKAMGERLVAWHAGRYGNPYACLRYFNVGGARADGSLGEFATKKATQLIPVCIRAALSGQPLTVLGQDLSFPTRDGSAVRDFVHVEDLAEAHVTVLEGLHGGGSSGTFNVGNGAGVTVLEIVELCRKVSGSDFELIFGPARAGDAPESWAQTDLIYRTYGFRARRTIEQLMQSEWEWATSGRPALT